MCVFYSPRQPLKGLTPPLTSAGDKGLCADLKQSDKLKYEFFPTHITQFTVENSKKGENSC